MMRNFLSALPQLHMTPNIVRPGSPDDMRRSLRSGTGHETSTRRTLAPSDSAVCLFPLVDPQGEALRPDRRRCVLSLRNFVQLQSHMAKQVTVSHH
ncbi:hypothetical protein M3J09_004871 [Ascochyta lentis]